MPLIFSPQDCLLEVLSVRSRRNPLNILLLPCEAQPQTALGFRVCGCPQWCLRRTSLCSSCSSFSLPCHHSTSYHAPTALPPPHPPSPPPSTRTTLSSVPTILIAFTSLTDFVLDNPPCSQSRPPAPPPKKPSVSRALSNVHAKTLDALVHPRPRTAGRFHHHSSHYAVVVIARAMRAQVNGRRVTARLLVSAWSLCRQSLTFVRLQKMLMHTP
jgi:hypothetical protein